MVISPVPYHPPSPYHLAGLSVLRRSPGTQFHPPRSVSAVDRVRHSYSVACPGSWMLHGKFPRERRPSGLLAAERPGAHRVRARAAVTRAVVVASVQCGVSTRLPCLRSVSGGTNKTVVWLRFSKRAVLSTPLSFSGCFRTSA